MAIQQIATDAFGNALGSSLAESLRPAAPSIYSLGGTGPSATGLRVPRDWSDGLGRSNDVAVYGQFVNAFSNPTQFDGGDSVLLAAGPGYSGMGMSGGDRLQVNRDISVFEEASALAASSGRASVNRSASGFDDVRDTSPATGLMVNPKTGLADFKYTSGISNSVNNSLDSLLSDTTAGLQIDSAGMDRASLSNSTLYSVGGRFVSGAFYGAVNMVWQPIAQTLDLGQASIGLLSGGQYEPAWLSGISRDYAAGMSYGETVTRAALGSNPVTGIGLASYDLTSNAMKGDWGGVAEGLGGMAGSYGLVKGGQHYFASEPGAQLGVYRVRESVETPNPLSDPGGLLPALSKWDTPNFTNAEPVFIGGKPLYRVSDGVFGDRTKAQANGAYWATEVAPATEGTWRGRYAVLNEWPNRGGIEGTWVPDGGWAWGGKAAPQAISGQFKEFTVMGSTYRAGWIQPGGGYQIMVPNSYSVIPPSAIQFKPTPWNK